jgi:SOS-response transcriptional repressor LexA
MPGAISKRQKEILDFIKLYIHERGYSPTHREIMRGVGGKSIGNIHRIITILDERGHIKTHPGRRGIEIEGPNAGELERLRDVKNAAEIFVSNQVAFREAHTRDPLSVATSDLSRKVQASFKRLSQLVEKPNA